MRTPREIRLAIRRGLHPGNTSALAPGYVQANLVILPGVHASDFQLFCQRNPAPCPLLAVTPPGEPVLAELAPGADLRTDLPLYRIYRHGELAEEVTSLQSHWREDLVGFLLGCSFTFDSLLQEAGLPVRHLEEGVTVPMYRTTQACRGAGVFEGPLVVSMRPMPRPLVELAVELTAGYPLVHGAPVQVGEPHRLGIQDLRQPDWGDPVTVYPDEVPVFWACGVTPQAVALHARLPLVLTHAPGHMLVTDRPARE